MSLSDKIIEIYPDIKNVEKLLEAWGLAYPSVDLEAEFRKAHAWEISNPKKKKKNHSRFLSNWFASAQKNSKRGRRNLTADDVWGK